MWSISCCLNSRMSTKMSAQDQSLPTLYAHDKQSAINGFLWPSKITAELLEIFPTLPFRCDDVVVATYPKAGTTWVEEIVWQVCNDGAVDKTSIHKRIPYLEMRPRAAGATTDDIIKLVENQPSRIFKTHFPIKFVPTEESTKDSRMSNVPKYICVMRNPKDTAVSFFHFYHGLRMIDFDGTWDEYFEMFIRGKVLYNSWFDHVLGWWQRRDDPKTIILKYEDMKKDLPSAVKQIAEFIGKDLSQDMVDKIARQTTFDSMKEQEQYDVKDGYKETEKFFRKGQIGDWKNYFTEEQNRRMDAMIAEKLSGTGLEFDYE